MLKVPLENQCRGSSDPLAYHRYVKNVAYTHTLVDVMNIHTQKNT